VIIGLAGHIDHGKTTLVHALTGVDTDRLKEEKARGMSIELGYAYVPLENGEVLGYVDVPGHERLVHTMAAGVCGIEFALLVVAADDGVMPQTREHLAILELFGVRQGAVALTKVDRVDTERLLAVERQVSSMLAGSALREAPIFRVDARTGAHPGTAALRHHLHETAVRSPERSAEGLYRLAVDRVFNLPGRGVVVTGTVCSGQIVAGAAARLMPSGVVVRVRSIHAQHRPAGRGRAGQRCALNLVGIEQRAIARGDWLADPGVFAPTSRIDARLRLLPGTGLRLGAWSPLHIHVGTAHRLAHIVPLDAGNLCAGDEGRVQLVFDRLICALPGDRFIARDAQGAHTVGGGVVLDPYAPARKRRSAQRRGALDALERMIAGEGITALLMHAPYGIEATDLVRLTGRPLRPGGLRSDTVLVQAGAERFLFLDANWRALLERVVGALRVFHAEVPDEVGVDAGRLRRIACPEIADALWRAAIDALTRERRIDRTGPWLHLPEHRMTLTEDDRELAQQLQPLLARGHFDPPWVRALAVQVHAADARVRDVLRKLAVQGAVYQVVHDLYYDRGCIDELADILDALARQHGCVEAARYRDAIHVGRKRAVQILEFFDRVGYTRRVRDAHLPRADSAWKAHAPGGAAGLQTQQGASAAPW